MLKYIIVIIFLNLFGLQIANSQNCESNQLNLHKITAREAKMYYLQYDGKPFIYDKWLKGHLTLAGGEVYRDLNIKIDVFKDEVLYFNKSLNKQLVIDKNIIRSVELIGDYKVDKIITHQVGDSSMHSSYELYFVLLADSISLWCKRIKDINLNTDFSSRYAKLGTFYSKDKYYFVVNGELTRIPLRKGKILSYFPDVKKELSLFIRKNRYDITNEEHLAKVFEQINRLKGHN